MIGRTLFRLAHWARKSHALQLYDEIRLIPFRSPASLETLRLAMLRRLLLHAQAKVPYYREMFRREDFHPDDLRSPDDLAQLPILTKDMVRERKNELLREDVSLDNLQPHFSGGSTGVPLAFHREPQYADYAAAGTYRNLAQCGWKPGEFVAYFWGWDDRLASMSPIVFEMRQRLRRFYQFDPFQSGAAEMDLWIRKWQRLPFTVAYGYTSTMARFAEHVRARGYQPPPLKGVFCTAEKLHPPQRAVLESVFGCKVYDCYGSSEIQNISTECSSGNMHINSDFVLVETPQLEVAATARPLIVTSLLNFGMPFIRYRNDDCGELLSHSCTCPNAFPLMKLGISRVSDNFTLPNGRVVHGEFFTHLLYGTQGIANFQFHQERTDSITLWYVPAAEGVKAKSRTFAEVARQVERLAPGQLTFVVKETDTIPLSRTGKHRFVRSDVTTTHTANPE